MNEIKIYSKISCLFDLFPTGSCCVIGVIEKLWTLISALFCGCCMNIKGKNEIDRLKFDKKMNNDLFILK